ncbi:MAG TPA: T9SS type A sorting domain-containing protein [Bacteroidia bacterium]|nr:T9SS type A sorting domain-containing protein [Bacteroidia bacterium]HRH09815.1 T9SS type A sorting domain-containing protein [Bacteroidia bacterium]HRH62024.1 T9SS type A sorting domain-containing protein [Bacteroidia bacterium]
MYRQLLVVISFIFSLECTQAQSIPVALKQGIQIDRILTLRNGAVRLAKNPLNGNFYYNDASGNIFEITIPSSGFPFDSLLYTTADHGVQYPQCIAFYDSVLYVSGNNDHTTKYTTGIIRKGSLQANGTRVWSTLMLTEPYPTADYFDHLFSGMVLSTTGDSITICSGARGDHGEVQSRYNFFPGLRNVPLTSILLRIPTDTFTFLYNDSAWLANSGFVFARGIRNTFSMAYDGNGNLFGVENSCGRDHHEEMNWLRRGKHYGFPYVMGDTYNPQQYANYIPANDFMISHYSPSWSIHAWTNDPGFPAAPAVSFEAAIQNFGPDCDKFRDTLNGGIKDASDLGISMGTFTAHRSPLGLVFDTDSLIDASYTGDGFMLSWTPGLDSCGCIANPDSTTGPFVDPSEDLVHLHLMYDSLLDNYTLNAERIVGSFHNPVDAVIDSNFIYVIENGYGATSGFFKITLPPLQTKIQQVISENSSRIYPNPASEVIAIGPCASNSLVVIYNALGKQMHAKITREINKIYIDCSDFAKGIYFVEVSNHKGSSMQKLIIQ